MDDERREAVDLRRVQIVAAHEHLDTTQRSFAFEAER